MKAKQLQENNVDIAPVTHEDIVFDSNGKNIPNKYQTKEDNALDTTNKTIVGAINELFQNVSSGKELIATAIADKGVTTSSDDTFQTMADNIGLIKGGSNLPSWCPNFWIEGEPSKVAMGLSSASINNEIYLIGGRDYDSVSASFCTDVNVYNIENNIWSKKTTIPTPRCWLTSDVINNKIYSIGGYASTGAINTNECYDPLTNTWSSKTSSPWYVYYHTSSVIDNNIYIIGGYWSDSTSDNYCYDTLTDTWSSKTKTSRKRYQPTSNAIGDKIYCMGGYVNNVYDDNLCYDTLTDTWSTKSSMLTATYGLVSEVINNKIYCIGGRTDISTVTLKNAIEVYDVNTDSWKEEGSIKTPRYDFTSEMINDIIYTFCGYTTTSLNITEGYVVAEDIKLGSEEVRSGKELIANAITDKGISTSPTDSFQTMANNIGLIEGSSDKNEVLPKWDSNIYILNTQEPSAMPIGRRQMVSGVIDKKIYIIGGYSNNSSIALNQCYDTETNTWTDKTDDLTARYEGTASVINDNIYVIGGRYASGSFTDLNECYNSSTNTWTTKTVLPTTRTALTSSVVDNKIYVIDGSNGSQTGGNHCYDYLTDTWTTKTDDPVARYGSTSCVVNNKIYCFAGAKQNNYMTIYDPSTDTWEQKGDDSRLINRHYASSVAKNGYIYILGGYSGATYISSINKYDFETDSWIKIGDLATPRYNHVVGIVGSVVYVFGGRISADITYSDNCECICIIDNYN